MREMSVATEETQESKMTGPEDSMVGVEEFF